MISIATVGTSMITRDFLDVLRQRDDARFIGTCSRDAGRAAAFTAEFGGTVPFTSVEELAASPEVDAVYLGSPNALHAEQALACIHAGKHVLVEKPFAADEREARRVFEAAGTAGVVALEAMRPLHDPAFRACAAAFNELGRIRRATLRFGKYSSRYDEILAGRRTNIFDCVLASGGLMDMGVYSVEPPDRALWRTRAHPGGGRAARCVHAVAHQRPHRRRGHDPRQLSRHGRLAQLVQDLG